MNDPVRVPDHTHSYRLHHRSTFRRPITRIPIDMPTPQAVRAVIRIPITNDGFPAMPAGEIFPVSHENHTQFFKKISLMASSSPQEYFRLAE